jgi:hypothetical protein
MARGNITQARIRNRARRYSAPETPVSQFHFLKTSNDSPNYIQSQRTRNATLANRGIQEVCLDCVKSCKVSNAPNSSFTCLMQEKKTTPGHNKGEEKHDGTNNA